MSNQFVMRSVVPLTLLLLLLHLAQGRDLQQQGNSTVFISSRRDLKRAVSTLSSGDVLDFRTQRIRVSRTFDIYERNVTIRSRLESGTTIECDGSREAAVFRIYNGDVRFSRVHFEGCANAPISIQVEDDDDPIVFDRVEFRRNRGVGPFGRGGAFLIVGCASSGCRVARTFPPTVIIQRCTFQSNLATLGGAIFADNVNLTISESTFDSNEAERRGGAVYITGVRSTLALERTSFKNNTIRRSGNDLEVTLERGLPLEVLRYIRFPFPDAVGGAVSIHSIVQTTVDECHFRHNRAPAGGAIATETLLEAKRGALDPSFSVFINNSTFEENTAAFAEPMSSSQVSMGLLGGAIYSLSTDRDLSWEALNCSFEKNVAHDGGAIHIVTHRLSTPSIHGSTFLDNEATSFGGALLLRNMGAMDIRDCVFEGNGARSGGAVFVTNNALCFVRGLAGLPPDPRTGNRTIFVRNRAERGGAIGCLACSDLIIQDALFMQNEGRTEGGGLYVYDSDAMVSILQATFDGNRALKGGGAFFDHVTVVRLTAAAQSLATVFSNNEAISGSAVSYTATQPKENRFLMANVEVLSNRELPADIMAQSASVIQGGGTVDLVLDLVPSFAVADILLDNVTINDNIARRGGGVRIEAEGQWNEQVIFRCPSTRFRADPCRLLRFVDVRIVNNRAIEGAGLLVTDGQTLSLLCWSDAQMSFTSLSGILLDNDHQNTNALDSNCTYIDNNFITGTNIEENVKSP